MSDITTLQAIVSGFRVWILVSFGLAVVGFFIAAWNKYSSNKWHGVGIAMFVQVFISAFIGIGVDGLLQKRLRQAFYHHLSSGNLTVSICNNDSRHKENDIIKELRKTRRISQHHSSPTEPVYINISKGTETSIVTLRRDSDVRYEYWVYWKTDQYGENEIGRIRTLYFDSIRCD